MKQIFCSFFFLSSMFIFALPQTTAAQTALDEIYEPREYISDEGDTLRYRVMFPEKFNEGETYPLVLFLH